jgi:ATP-dependent RNA helicase DHX29
MAGGKKKKKPASNPARGFATTSIASKPKAESSAADSVSSTSKELPEAHDVQQVEQRDALRSGIDATSLAKATLSPEEFEKQLEDQELQLLVEKHAAKSKREALRQKTRLETERRVLRTQAENLSTRKWLPTELMDEILDMVKAEGRYTGQSSDASTSQKPLSEEDLTIRLWTLYQALIGAGFFDDKSILALRHVLDISDKITASNKDAIWGMEEALDWLSRECSRKELPDYESWQKRVAAISKSQARKCRVRSFVSPKLTSARNSNR